MQHKIISLKYGGGSQGIALNSERPARSKNLQA
jgi:hypothetical protein